MKLNSLEDMARNAQHHMSKFLNVIATSNEDFVEEMGKDHRYLQAMFTELCFAWITANAKRLETGLYDGRNKWAVEKSAEIMRKVDLMGPAELKGA